MGILESRRHTQLAMRDAKHGEMRSAWMETKGKVILVTYCELLVSVFILCKGAVLDCNDVITALDGNDPKFNSKLTLDLLEILQTKKRDEFCHD